MTFARHENVKKLHSQERRGALSSNAPGNSNHGPILGMREIRQIVEIHSLPPFLTLEQAAHLCQLSPGTIRNQVSQGRFTKSAIRGKPLRFITSVFVQEFCARREVAK